MKIKINNKASEAAPEYKIKGISVGDVSVEIEKVATSNEAWVKVIIPLTSDRGYPWKKETSVTASNNIGDIIMLLFREAVATALFNADRRKIMTDEYSMSNIAKWEESIYNDRKGISDVNSAIQLMLRG